MRKSSCGGWVVSVVARQSSKTAKKSVKCQLFMLSTIFQISDIKISSQKEGPPFPRPLELPYLPYAMSVIWTDNKCPLNWTGNLISQSLFNSLNITLTSLIIPSRMRKILCSSFFRRPLKAPLVNPRTYTFSELKCNCRYYNTIGGTIMQLSVL